MSEDVAGSGAGGHGADAADGPAARSRAAAGAPQGAAAARGRSSASVRRCRTACTAGSACPLPDVPLWGEEMDSPRGRIHLVSQLLDGAPLTPGGGRALRPVPRLHGLHDRLPVRRAVRPDHRGGAGVDRGGGNGRRLARRRASAGGAPAGCAAGAALPGLVCRGLGGWRAGAGLTGPLDGPPGARPAGRCRGAPLAARPGDAGGDLRAVPVPGSAARGDRAAACAAADRSDRRSRGPA